MGGLMNHYFSFKYGNNECKYDAESTEMHPLKWVLTRQIGTIFWYVGEIFADWYPLLRTKAVIQKQKSIWYVYASCGFFNLSKISLILYHFTLSPKELFDNEGHYNKGRVDNFYNTYWIIQLIIMYASVIYDFTVFHVLKKNVFKVNKSEIGFMKKFRTISEYRIYVSVIISFCFMPIASIAIFTKFFFIIKDNYTGLDFNFDDIRTLIANGQYYMIFIDQILLLRSSEETKNRTTKSSYFLGNSKSNLTKSINNDKTYYNITEFDNDNNNNIFDKAARMRNEKLNINNNNYTFNDGNSNNNDNNKNNNNNKFSYTPLISEPTVDVNTNMSNTYYNRINFDNNNSRANRLNNNILNNPNRKPHKSNVADINTNFNNGWY